MVANVGAFVNPPRGRDGRLMPLVLLLAFLGAHFAVVLTHGPLAHSIPPQVTHTVQCGPADSHPREVERGTAGQDSSLLPGPADHDDQVPHSHPDFSGTLSNRSSDTDELTNPALWLALAGFTLLVGLSAWLIAPSPWRNNWATRPRQRLSGMAFLLFACELRT
ncbi:hypothetical protein [Saccharopolyspora shandongensis]|uniref:hypothetical protein n=1 Tax=Saccharopolyspora shandongensis TaxID=418495 RepID=UPI0033D36B4A